MANNQTIKASFGMDVGPLRAAAKEAAIIGRKIKKELTGTFKEAGKEMAKSVAEGVTEALKRAAELVVGWELGKSLEEGVKGAYELGRKLDDLSEQTGIAAGKIAILRQAFEDTGESADDVGTAVNRMQRYLENAAHGGALAKETIMGMGLSLTDVLAMTPDQQFLAIGNAINRIPDPALRAADAMAIFGRSRGEFLGLFGDKGIYERAAETLGGQAQLLSANAAVFSRIAVSLSHIGVKLQGFFVGVAAQLAPVLVPLLDKFEKLDLSGIGQKFGDGLIRGVQFVVGAFQNPKAFIGVATDALMYGVLSAGNVLLAAMKAAKEYFQGGMLDTIKGIGDVLLAVLTKAFAVPIAYLQASIADVLSRIPKALGGTGGAKEERRGHLDAAHANEKLGRDAYASIDPFQPKPSDAANRALGDKYFAAASKEYLAAKAVRPDETVEERAQALMAGGGPLIATARGNMKANQLLAQGTGELQSGLGAAGADIGRISIPDALGAAKYGEALAAGAAPLISSGAQTMSDYGIMTGPTPEDRWRLAGYGLSGFAGQLGHLPKPGDMDRMASFGPDNPFRSAHVQAAAGLDNGHSGLGDAYGLIRRGDAARAKRATAAAKQEGKETTLAGVSPQAASVLAKAIGRELEVR